MGSREAFVLLDDARGEGAAKARVYERPARIFVAHRADAVEPVLAAAQAALRETGGTLAGYLAYEAGLALEPRLADRAPAHTGAAGPLVWLGLFERETILDAEAVPGWLASHGEGPAAIGPLEPAVSPGGHAQGFNAFAEKIRAGDIYQGNYTFPLTGSYRGDPLALYAALRPAAQAGCGGVVFDGSHWLLSLSPELFVSLQDGTARARPMKGTRPRSADPARDAELVRELAASDKERAENLMIVDLMRNDLSRVAQAGSVAVEAPFAVESYPTVHQMVTTVTARLAPGHDAIDLVRALFPCGSITGAPKIRAMEVIDTVERDARGPYCGAIGRIGAGGDAAFNVAIRTLRLTPTENGHGNAVLGVGSAIVADSEAQAEWREAVLKGGFVRASGPGHTAPAFDLIETMRFDPEEGIALLEAHLARLKDSAATLGFAFDRHALRNQIQALCFDLDGPARVRLACSRSGAVALEAAPCPPSPAAPLRCIVLPLPVDPGDWRLAHKTSDRVFYEDARAVALAAGADEALFVQGDGLLTEGSFTSILAGPDGDFTTPPAALGLLPGVQRGALIEANAAREGAVRLADIEDGFHLCNALRGVMRAELLT